MKSFLKSGLLMLALITFLFSAPNRAYAGHWTVSFQCKGETSQTGQPSHNGTGPTGTLVYTNPCNSDPYRVLSPVTIIWPTTLTAILGSTAAFHPDVRYCWVSHPAGAITPVLTWTKDNVSDSSLPPLTVIVQEDADAFGYSELGEVSGPLTASDGLGDPAQVITWPGLPGCIIKPKEVYSNGTRILSIDTGGKMVLTLAPVFLSASGGVTNDDTDTSSQVLLKISFPHPVQAQSTFGTLDSTRPDWFSGTNCTATGIADLGLLYGGTSNIPSGDYITSATISVGGTVVKSYPEDYIGVLPPSGQTSVPNLAAAWDSTHFADGTPVTVEVEVHDAKGKGYKAHLKAPIYNKALALGNNTFDDNTAQDSVAAVSAALGLSYYITVTGLQDNVATILEELPQYTAFYIDTHGSPGVFDDCFATGDNIDNYVGYVQVGTVILGTTYQGKTTGGKSAAQPPYNFAMFDACAVMGDKYNDPEKPDDAGMAVAFGLANGIDRAAISWDRPSFSNDNNVQWTKGLWDYLAEGVPLREAATRSSLYNSEEGPVNVFGKQAPYIWTYLNPVIQGDSNMTLHGVYGGTSYSRMNQPFVPKSTWYKRL